MSILQSQAEEIEALKMELQNKSDETEKQVREVVEKGLQLQMEMMNLTKELSVLTSKEGK